MKRITWLEPCYILCGRLPFRAGVRTVPHQAGEPDEHPSPCSHLVGGYSTAARYRPHPASGERLGQGMSAEMLERFRTNGAGGGVDLFVDVQHCARQSMTGGIEVDEK